MNLGAANKIAADTTTRRGTLWRRPLTVALIL